MVEEAAIQLISLPVSFKEAKGLGCGMGEPQERAESAHAQQSQHQGQDEADDHRTKGQQYGDDQALPE